jgi:hypothetical protein
MDPWSVGLVVLIVLGLAAIVFGALWDRARNRRRAAEMLAPPSRAIPRFRPDAPAPRYLSELQARRPATATVGLRTDERAEVRRQLDDPTTLVIGAGYASADFVTDPDSGWAVLEEPVVLVCGDQVASVRELLGLLERVLLSGRALVLVAPAVAREVLATLEVNRIQRRLAVVVVLAERDDDRAAVARASGGRPTGRGDRQAGYLPPADLGECRRWVSTARTSHLVAGGAAGG